MKVTNSQVSSETGDLLGVIAQMNAMKLAVAGTIDFLHCEGIDSI